MKKWVVTQTAVVENGKSYNVHPDTRVTIRGKKVIFEEYKEAPVWEDITLKCKPKMVQSQRSKQLDDDSRYFALIYENSPIIVMRPTRMPTVKDGFKIEVPEGAKMSFKVFKKTE